MRGRAHFGIQWCPVHDMDGEQIGSNSGNPRAEGRRRVMGMDRSTIKTLAEANGLNFSDDRLDLILRQYQGFLRTMEEIDSVEYPRETEPAITFSNTLPSLQSVSTVPSTNDAGRK